MPRTAGSKNGVRKNRKVAQGSVVHTFEDKDAKFQELQRVEEEWQREQERNAEWSTSEKFFKAEGKRQMLKICDEAIEDLENVILHSITLRRKLRALQKDH